MFDIERRLRGSELYPGSDMISHTGNPFTSRVFEQSFCRLTRMSGIRDSEERSVYGSLDKMLKFAVIGRDWCKVLNQALKKKDL